MKVYPLDNNFFLDSMCGRVQKGANKGLDKLKCGLMWIATNKRKMDIDDVNCYKQMEDGYTWAYIDADK